MTIAKDNSYYGWISYGIGLSWESDGGAMLLPFATTRADAQRFKRWQAMRRAASNLNIFEMSGQRLQEEIDIATGEDGVHDGACYIAEWQRNGKPIMRHLGATE